MLEIRLAHWLGGFPYPHKDEPYPNCKFLDLEPEMLKGYITPKELEFIMYKLRQELSKVYIEVANKRQDVFFLKRD